jgi:penicillin-binding protein 1A
MKRRRVEIGLGLAGALIAASVLWRNCGIHECPNVERLASYRPNEASVILDRDGSELGKLFLERRVIVALEDLPQSIPDAFVAMEDQRFWAHHGVDWRRVFGAGWRNIREIGVAEGASTITMQLARNVFPESLPSEKRTIWRKLREARVATEIESKFTKRQILELYLNQIYFGNAAHGNRDRGPGILRKARGSAEPGRGGHARHGPEKSGALSTRATIPSSL